jgi:hypothetical protein
VAVLQAYPTPAEVLPEKDLDLEPGKGNLYKAREVAHLIFPHSIEWVHYVILTGRPLEDSTVGGWPEKILDQPTCGGVPHGRGSRYLR